MVHLDVHTSPFEGYHPAVNLRLRDPPIRLRHLVALHQEAVAVRVGLPEHYTVNQEVVRSAAAKDYVTDLYCTRFRRLDQQQVAIAQKGLHAGPMCLEAQALAEAQDLSAQQGKDRRCTGKDSRVGQLFLRSHPRGHAGFALAAQDDITGSYRARIHQPHQQEPARAYRGLYV